MVGARWDFKSKQVSGAHTHYCGSEWLEPDTTENRGEMGLLQQLLLRPVQGIQQLGWQQDAGPARGGCAAGVLGKRPGASGWRRSLK